MPLCAAAKRPAAIGHRAGERALYVTEELGLEQRVGDRAAVHADERLLLARRQVMQRARDQLLAGARLAGDEDRGLGRRDLLHQLEDALHGQRLADDAVEAEAAAQLVAQLQVVAQEGALLQRALDDHGDLVDLERLGQIVVSAALHRRDGGLGRGKGGDDNHLRVRLRFFHRLQHVEAAAVLHFQIGDHHVERLIVDGLLRGAGRFGQRHLVAGARQRDAQEVAHRPLVVDDQNLAHQR